MAYLVIPEITEHEEVVSYSVEADGRTFNVAINHTATATRLFNAAARGERLPLVVLATDGPTIALDDVYVTGATPSATGGDMPQAHITLQADAVRYL